MTNLLNIPPFDGANTSFSIVFDADWNDEFYIGAPGFAAAPVILTGVSTSSGDTLTGLTGGANPTAGIAVGSLVQGAGIPSGTTVSGVNSTTEVTLNQNATESLPAGTFYFFPPPLDLTGITFTSQLRQTLSSASALIVMSTSNGLMKNGTTSGLFGWSVPAATLRASALLPIVQQANGEASFVGDITATDSSGAFINLSPAAPFTVNARLGATR